MTIALIIRCDGTPAIRPTISLGQCRAAYPAEATDPEEALAEAYEHDWEPFGEEHLCPSCARYLP